MVLFGATAGALGVSVLLTQVNGLTAALGRPFFIFTPNSGQVHLFGENLQIVFNHGKVQLCSHSTGFH